MSEAYDNMQEQYGVALFQAAELASQIVQAYLVEQSQRPLSDRRSEVPTDIDVALRLLAIVQGQ
ncbi:hypothetical protein KR51_00029700 [Rubidibacter lacunae KORDI 51-2]|uniref:Uncharacterized protein n=1 Tax=Rubidibacter lacunae KORDI 51-2 TaxID=582515 RepID=U5DIK9_9CHRO|nr:hypothetical protein [Rubidibacter lacunae]ERN40429.1 hypothetical protein KR51_00029700 [Rubidibacter lacunae KORDI 51-2]